MLFLTYLSFEATKILFFHDISSLHLKDEIPFPNGSFFVLPTKKSLPGSLRTGTPGGVMSHLHGVSEISRASTN